MCDQFHDGTGFLTHHLALTNSFEVSCAPSLSFSHSFTHTHSLFHTHTFYNTFSHQHPHCYLLTRSLHLNAATGRYAHGGSIGHSALLGLHNRGAIHHVSAGRSHFSQHCLHCWYCKETCRRAYLRSSRSLFDISRNH